MATKTEGRHTGEFVVSESPGTISRENVTVTVAAGATLVPGSALGRIAATGKYVPYANAAGDGSEVAIALLYDTVHNAAGAPADFKATVITRVAEVRKADLNWHGQGQPAIDAGLVDLEARFVLAR